MRAARCGAARNVSLLPGQHVIPQAGTLGGDCCCSLRGLGLNDLPALGPLTEYLMHRVVSRLGLPQPIWRQAPEIDGRIEDGLHAFPVSGQERCSKRSPRFTAMAPPDSGPMASILTVRRGGRELDNLLGVGRRVVVGQQILGQRPAQRPHLVLPAASPARTGSFRPDRFPLA